MNHYFYEGLYLRQKFPSGKEDCGEPGFADTAAEGNTTTLPWKDTTKYLDPYPQVPLVIAPYLKIVFKACWTTPNLVLNTVLPSYQVKTCWSICQPHQPSFLLAAPEDPSLPRELQGLGFPLIKRAKSEVSKIVQCLRPYFFPEETGRVLHLQPALSSSLAFSFSFLPLCPELDGG